MTTISLAEEAAIRQRIQELRSRLPQETHEPREPLHTVVTKVFKDRAHHTKTVDIANAWHSVGKGIREAIRQGGEVTLRPLFPGEEPQEHKDYPSTKRIRELEAALGETLALLRDLPSSGGIVGLAVIEAAQDTLDKGKAGDQ